MNISDKPSQDLLSRMTSEIITYGKDNTADFQLLKVQMSNGNTDFTVKHGETTYSYTLHIPGEHNALNATGVIAVLRQLGLNNQEIAQGLLKFHGTKRRFELVGQAHGKLLYDDYAHHPAEIQATLKAVKAWFPNKRLIVIFQPHTYSRTKALLNDFAAALRADCVVLLEVYGSARETTKTVSSSDILAAMPKGSNAVFQPTLTAATAFLKKTIRDGDVVCLLGAGDVWRIADLLGARISAKPS